MKSSQGSVVAATVFLVMSLILGQQTIVHYAVAMLCVSYICRAIEDKK